MHPSKEISGVEGRELEGENIAICATGSVAVIRVPKLARTLMRHGADVRVIMSEMAARMVGPDLLHWATGNPVITELTGEIEHVEVAEWADLVLVAPATANTIGKVANGIDDTPPTSVVSVAQGLDKGIIVAPAMHESMYSHGIINENISRLKDLGFQIIEPDFEEGKAKIPSVREMAGLVMNFFRAKDLKDEHILITAGPTIEKLDPVRILTNRSSGKMGVSLVRAALARAAEVTLIYGPGSEPVPAGVNLKNVETTEEMLAAVKEELEEGKYDLFVCAAAPQDFKPEEYSDEKFRRSETIQPKLVPTPGILEKASEIADKTFLVGFKAECNVSDKQLLTAAEDKMEKHDLDMVVANDLMRSGAGFGTDTNDVVILSRSGSSKTKATKDEIANAILDIFVDER
ncbi:hypothetical protein AKJ51_01925 [candidate division MSBL1 archaeon SCGC-AAA382A20]|uniref:Coenzyme A biosynthesis bifunctional protein CoaBC n=1 Tax=candidate division MSBL1 archaeon SCGC-AAA382A20 TaxID=1698280 RepID=A0A133VL24_9EURY|nr:hypothetical protein AKJ51_01925 [candidate division MSBL1 archaeon SCGC-AAA382A20]